MNFFRILFAALALFTLTAAPLGSPPASPIAVSASASADEVASAPDTAQRPAIVAAAVKSISFVVSGFSGEAMGQVMTTGPPRPGYITSPGFRFVGTLNPIAPTGLVSNSPFLTTLRGSSSATGTGATTGVNDWLGLTKAAVTTPLNLDFAGVGGGTTSDVSQAFTNPANAHYVTTGQKAGNVVMEYFGSSVDLTSGNESTLIGLVQGAVATLPDTSKFYYMAKYNVGDASSSATNIRDNVTRMMETLYPANTLYWSWIMQNLTPLYPSDIDAEALGMLPPGYSNDDNLHMNPLGYAATNPFLFEHPIRGQAGELPFIADGRMVYTNASTAVTSGGFVADMPILDDLTGTTLSTTSPDFAFAQTPGNSKSIRITRASSTVLKGMWTLVPLTEKKIVGGKLFVRTPNLRLSIGLPQPAAPAINRWNGGGISWPQLGNAQTITDFSFVVGLRVSPSLDSAAVTFQSSNGFSLTKGASGLVTLTVKQFSNTSNAILIGQSTTLGVRLTSANGLVWYFFEGSTASGSQLNRLYVNDTSSAGTGQANVADSILGFWKAGSITFWNDGSPDTQAVNFNATMADEARIPGTLHVMRVQGTVPTGIYPNSVVTGSGVTASTIVNTGLSDGSYSVSKASTIATSTAMTATTTNSARPVVDGWVDVVGPFFYPGKINVADAAIRAKFKDGSGNPVDPGTTVAGFTPCLDMRGNSADMWHGGDGTVPGAMAKNYGTCGDAHFRYRGLGSVATQ